MEQHVARDDKMKILYAVLSWGLGHAGRTVPLVQALQKQGHEVTILAHGRSLEFLRRELKNCKFIDLPDYPAPYTKTGFSIAKTLLILPLIMSAIRKEKKAVKKILAKEKYDRIISDQRYSVYSKKIPSYFISNQVRFIAPGRMKLAETITEWFNDIWQTKFKKIMVPDFKDNNLTGDLTHNLRFNNKNIEYLGIVTDIRKKDVKQDIDYYFTISGPEPERTYFEKKIMKQLKQLKGKIVITLAKPEEKFVKKEGNVTIYSFVDRKKQEEIMNRAKIVITRAGFTTITELVELEKKALLIPTKGQTEQEYLAYINTTNKNFYSVKQEKLNLETDLLFAEQARGFKPEHKSEESIKKFLEIVSS